MAEQLSPRPQANDSRPQTNGFQTAVEDLTDGLSRLVRNHFDLARAEVRQEAAEMKLAARDAAICGALAIAGYALLMIAIIATAFWLGGIAAMAITSIILAALHLIGTGIAFVQLRKHGRRAELGMPQTTEELQRNKKWIKEIRDNSSPKLTAESS